MELQAVRWSVKLRENMRSEGKKDLLAGALAGIKTERERGLFWVTRPMLS